MGLVELLSQESQPVPVVLEFEIIPPEVSDLQEFGETALVFAGDSGDPYPFN